jgi:hypothetical protein
MKPAAKLEEEKDGSGKKSCVAYLELIHVSQCNRDQGASGSVPRKSDSDHRAWIRCVLVCS